MKKLFRNIQRRLILASEKFERTLNSPVTFIVIGGIASILLPVLGVIALIKYIFS